MAPTASASQIGSRVVSGSIYIQLSKNWWGRLNRAATEYRFLVAAERDQGVARGPGGPPYFRYAAAGIWRLDFGFTRVFA
jgi:hypothetical protein